MLNFPSESKFTRNTAARLHLVLIQEDELAEEMGPLNPHLESKIPCTLEDGYI